MRNIGLAISGNLTGFSRFYANDEAKNLLNTTKINFDVHNLVSFLNNGEKLYAIFFSKEMVAVSLITNILDSFRRPGNLVVTVLIPRGFKIVDGVSSTRVNALYQLLNDVNDKFYEKNFLNGMVNQNPAVLMQDYYTEILSKFRLEPDRSQRKINGFIDIASSNKRAGYISALESSMPSYLSSIFRKSYEGYHYIFLASNAPQNIDEPAEEIITYKVRIENGNRPVPGEVRLTDRIPNINPEQGERDIPNKNFTYGQVLSGEAGTDIIGTIENGETIVLSYRFPKDEKTVYFRFYEGANEVPMALIRPVIVVSNGTSFNIPSDSYTFYGKEIYGRKTIKSGNPDYSIVGAGANLDLQRVQNGATININVERGWLWQFAPMWNNRPATIKPVNITLINRYNGDRITFTNVTSAISEKLSGNQSEWEMVIESDFYNDVRVPVNTPYRLDPKLVQQRTTTPTGNNSNGGRTVSPHNRITSTGQNDQGLRISKGDLHTAKDTEQIRREKNKRYITYGVAVIVACLLVFGGIWGYKALFGKDKKNVTIPEDDLQEMEVTFSVNGYDGKAIELENLLSELEISMTSNVVEIDNGNDKWSKKLSYPLKDDAIISVVISLKGHSDSIQFLSKDINYTEFSENIPLQLSISGNELNTYVELKNMRKPTENVGNQLNSLVSGSRQQMKFAKLLNSLSRQYLDNIAAKEDEEKRKAAEEARKAEEAAKKAAAKNAAKEVHSSGTDKIRDGFNALSLLLSPDKGSLMSNGQKLRPQNKDEQNRNDALIDVLKQLNGGAVPRSTPRALSSQQQKIINDLRRYARDLDNSGKAKLRSDLKKWKSLSQIQDNILPKNDNN